MKNIDDAIADGIVVNGGEKQAAMPEAHSGRVLFQRSDLRLTLLEHPVPGVGSYRSLKFGRTLELSTAGAETLAMDLDLNADAIGVRFNQMLIESFDGRRWRSHIPTAIACLRNEGWHIVDIQDDFRTSFLTYAMVEQAGAAMGWPAVTLEPHQIASPAVMALAREVAEQRYIRVSKMDHDHVRRVIASDCAAGKRATLSTLATALGPTPACGRAKVLALVAQGKFDIRQEAPRSRGAATRRDACLARRQPQTISRSRVPHGSG